MSEGAWPILEKLRRRMDGDPRQGQATDEVLHAGRTGETTKAVADRWHAKLDMEELL